MSPKSEFWKDGYTEIFKKYIQQNIIMAVLRKTSVICHSQINKK